MDEREENRPEQDPTTIPTDPQLAPQEQTGKRGMSGAPETPGGSSQPIDAEPKE
jgi:hypothetical protein